MFVCCLFKFQIMTKYIYNLQGLHVTDEDIALQEKRVLEARERLKEALNE